MGSLSRGKGIRYVILCACALACVCVCACMCVCLFSPISRPLYPICPVHAYILLGPTILVIGKSRHLLEDLRNPKESDVFAALRLKHLPRELFCMTRDESGKPEWHLRLKAEALRQAHSMMTLSELPLRMYAPPASFTIVLA